MVREIKYFPDKFGRGWWMEGCPLGNLSVHYCYTCKERSKYGCVWREISIDDRPKPGFWND